MDTGIVAGTRHALHPLRGRAERALWFVRRRLGLFDSESDVAAEAQRYWTAEPDGTLRDHSHWRGSPAFADDEQRWRAIGAEHLSLYRTFARAFGVERPLGRVLEWGCGGGTNVLAFAGECAEFVGVEVSPASLEECSRQAATIPGARFTPVLVSVAEPEAVLPRLRGSCDLFLSTYVFELLPSQQYGLRLLRLARELLVPGGIALVQIKYATGRWWTQPRRFAYSKDPANVTTYRIDEFWAHAERCGFTRQLVHLAIEQPLVGDGRYAYYGLLNGREERLSPAP
jgi:SAM-dependent methyltransferase